MMSVYRGYGVAPRRSVKTTAAGILAFLAILISGSMALLDDDPATNPDYGALVAAGTAAAGLLFARDNDVTSEEAGAK